MSTIFSQRMRRCAAALVAAGAMLTGGAAAAQAVEPPPSDPATTATAEASVLATQTDDPARDVDPMIVGGRDATEDYPWMASIQINWPDPTSPMDHTCGGAVIRDDGQDEAAVVTAAHCAVFYKDRPTQVRVGSYRWEDGGTLANVTRVTIYPGFNETRPGNDVAVLHLDRSVTDQVIRIPRHPGNVGDLDRVLGWGATCNFGSPAWPCYPAGLQESDVRIVADDQCFGFDRSVELCVKGDDGQMACFGDSGGPLAKKKDPAKKHNEWLLIGATRGDGDADSANGNLDCSGVNGVGGLGIWTDLTKYRDWIYRVANTPADAPANTPVAVPTITPIKKPIITSPIRNLGYTLPYERLAA